MDDGDYDADGYKLVKGDQVVVSGRVDNDFLEQKKIEAGSVYVKSLDTYFYASSDDELGYYSDISPAYTYVDDLPEDVMVDLQGVVKKIDGREFIIDTGIRTVTVDTSSLIYNPMDDRGMTQIDLLDRVKVSGAVEDEFFDGPELVATTLYEL